MKSLFAIIFIIMPLCILAKLDAFVFVLCFGITVGLFVSFIKCYYYRTTKRIKNKSLAFGFYSVRKQIEEFKFINRLVFLPEVIRVFLKRVSIVLDKKFASKYKNDEDYFGDSGYSISVTNMYHNHKSPFDDSRYGDSFYDHRRHDYSRREDIHGRHHR